MAALSAEPTGYSAYVTKMNSVLEANFGATVPNSTKRSGGLDPQCGLVIGLIPDEDLLAELLISAPPHVWSQYDSKALHLTLGACEDRSTNAVNTALADGRSMMERCTPLGQVLARAHGTDVSLTDVRVLVSGDTIVLTGQPSRGLYEVREQLTSAGEAQEAGIKPGWGAHLTLARAKEPLTDMQRLSTNQWLASLLLPETISFTKVMAAVFTVYDDAFRVARRMVRDLPAQ